MNLDALVNGPVEVLMSGHSVHGHFGTEISFLPEIWCLHHYDYEVSLIIEGKPFKIVPGCVTIIPPARKICFEYTAVGHHRFVHFSHSNPPSRWAAMEPLYIGPKVVPPLFQPCLEKLIEVRQGDPQWADLLLRNLLKLAAESHRKTASPMGPNHPLIKKAEQFVSRNLGRKFQAHEVAAHVGVTHQQLNRLMNSAHGQSIGQWIRRKRAERAIHLLQHSNRSIKSISLSVGIDNPQHFNKFLRKSEGAPPEQIRSLANRAPPQRNPSGTA